MRHWMPGRMKLLCQGAGLFQGERTPAPRGFSTPFLRGKQKREGKRKGKRGAVWQREAAGAPAPRELVARWAVGTPTCSTRPVGNVGLWREGKGPGAEWCPPALPRPSNARQIPAGWAHARVLAPG